MDRLDLSAISHVVALRQGWDDARRRRILGEYKAFLARAAHRARGEALSPTRDVDALWHAHMLHSEVYGQDCDRWFGVFIHHRPHLKKAEAELLIALGRLPKDFVAVEESSDCSDKGPADCDSGLQGVHSADCSSAERPPRPSPPPVPNPPRGLTDCSAPEQPEPPGDIDGGSLADCSVQGPDEPGGIETGASSERDRPAM